MKFKIAHLQTRSWIVALITTLALAGIGVAFVAAADQALQPVASKELTVAFWNIQWFPGGRPSASANAEKRQTTAVHSEIQKLNPDILGMEEVRNWDAAALAVQPLNGMKVDVCADFPPREGQFTSLQIGSDQ